MAGHVFISYGSNDSEPAEALCASIEARGVKAWIAPRDVRPGLDYSEALQGAIEGCAAFVVLVSETANSSPYVRAETEMAFSNSKPIFPVRMSDIKPAPGLAFFLKIRHWTDAYGKNREASLERLTAELQALAGAGPASAPAPEPAAAPAPTTPAAPPDRERLAAAIGPKAERYLERWRRMDEKKSVLGWNWAACLANLYWFAYRKLWLWLAVTAFAIVALAVIGALDPRLGMPTFLASIAITFVTGTFGDHLYRKQIQALAGDQALDLAALARRGGVSMAALLGAIGATLAAVALAVLMTMRSLPEPPPPAPALVLDQAYLVGRWTDESNCAAAFEFTADGRVISADGGAGIWSIDGDQLSMSGLNGAATVRVTLVDRNTMTMATPDGQSGTVTRC